MKKFLVIIIFATGLTTTLATAKGIYQTAEDFLQQTFASNVPRPGFVWLTGSLKQQVTAILQHPPTALRVRYWKKDQRIVWILDEIGKEKPITVAVVVNHNRIENIKVLVFRESRGDEVRHAFFTQQFLNAGLDQKQQLDRDIDGISGATLSVRALIKISRLALFLSQHITS